ncbi:hypothetical protein KR009_008770, partial [Drosophila setifemur]
AKESGDDAAPGESTAPICDCKTEKKEDASTEVVLMDIDNDLTTNERMPTLDELELEQPKQKAKPKREVKEVKEVKEEPEVKEENGENDDGKNREAQEEDGEKPATDQPAIKIEEDPEKPAEGNGKEKQEEPPPSSPEAPPNPIQRTGKVTRSSLNGNQGAGGGGARTPTILKRLRKSTRFKAKPPGKGNPIQSNGYNNGPNGVSGTLTTHLSSAGNHPSNSNKHGKSGPGGGGPERGGGGAGGVRNRRTLFKRPAQKTPKVQACTRFVKSVFYKGSYMQIGDIVSIVDGEQNLYYAQIRGLLVDAYCEKSAFLTWLIPTQDSPDPQEGFDPATYLIGPDEELSRKLCYLEFVMHAPSNYYYDRSTPFPLPDVNEYTAQRSGGFIWTRLSTVKRERESRTAHRAGERGGGAS